MLEELVNNRKSREEYSLAIGPCRTRLSLEPLDESVHCRLVELYALSGQRSLALKHYQRMRTILANELGGFDSTSLCERGLSWNWGIKKQAVNTSTVTSSP